MFESQPPSESTWKTDDGLNIAVSQWSVHSPRAVLLLIHGIGDHSGRFVHVAKQLKFHGITVIGPDLRGNGRSQGPRGYISDFDVFLDDLDMFWTYIQKQYGDLPRFTYGQSLGGLIVLYHAIKRNPSLAGIVATSPALGVALPTPYWKIAIGRTIGRLLPKFRLNTGLNVQELCDDQEAIERLMSDPLRHQRISAQMFFGMVDAGNWCLENCQLLDTSTLVMHGAQDRVTDHTASQRFVQACGDRCQLKIWPRGKHELHNMRNKDEVLRFATDWLRRQL